MLGADRCGAVSPDPLVCDRQIGHGGAHIGHPSWLDKMVASDWERIRVALTFRAGHYYLTDREEEGKAFLDTLSKVMDE